MYKTLNNKGFTLVELISVMVILVSISLVAVTSITDFLTKEEDKKCREQQELAISAAKIYFSLNNISGNEKHVTIGVLNGGIVDGVDYFKDDRKIDKLRLEDTITFNVITGVYKYNGTEVLGNCS